MEVAPRFPDAVPVRDSKTPDGPVLFLRRTAWSAFVAALKS
ncbi:DUF397 domain-containing protein [Streptomyces bullii]|uniref:DUF397 domain-containing protein n=1 Tax=Streptomyces bullii TaxID=349910 RepID=A0ABW0UYG2_9ACTN